MFITMKAVSNNILKEFQSNLYKNYIIGENDPFSE